jgi:hypothetical protein
MKDQLDQITFIRAGASRRVATSVGSNDQRPDRFMRWPGAAVFKFITGASP